MKFIEINGEVFQIGKIKRFKLDHAGLYIDVGAGYGNPLFACEEDLAKGAFSFLKEMITIYGGACEKYEKGD